MRVLHCIPSMEGGGAERQLTYLAKGLAETGCEVHVALTRGGQNLARLEAARATIHDLRPAGNYDPRILPRLLRTIAAVKPDVVQCWLLQMEILGALACIATGTPWVFSERASAKAYPRTLKNVLRVQIASLATGIVSNSAEGDAYWRERARPGVRRYIVENALPMDEIAAAPVATAEEAGTGPGESFVLYAGRLTAQKNPVTFVQAMQRLRSPAPFRALMCGDGPLRAEIQRLVEDHRLAGRVRLAGYASNLWSLMKRATVFVSTAQFEGSANVVLEAMACGCPLVVSDIPEHRELLDEESAILVDPLNPDAIALAIETVRSDSASASRRADIARQRAERYATSLTVQRYLQVYQDVVSRHSHGPRKVAV